MSGGEIWGCAGNQALFWLCVSAMLDYKRLGFMDRWGQGHPEKAHVSGFFGKTSEVFVDHPWVFVPHSMGSWTLVICWTALSGFCQNK